MLTSTTCPICQATCTPHDVVHFNKACNDSREKSGAAAGAPVHYFRCDPCGFCFAPEFADWRLEDFEARIYNDEYVLVDPDYLETRPRENARGLLATFGDRASAIRHLDYGGGNGLLSKILSDAGWRSQSYDPFVDRDIRPSQLGQFDLITAYEVFEHVPDVKQLVKELSLLLASDGIVIFSTLLSDGDLRAGQRLTWWYAAPRNGHISLFSRRSLDLLGASEGFKCGGNSTNLHVYWRQVPPWASHIPRQT
jgi:SAM-dependent methyltransferase